MSLYNEEEPQYFNLTEYKNIDDLNAAIESRISNGIYLNNVEKNINDFSNLPIDKTFIHIRYDSDYYCVLVEKCKFSGYLCNSIPSKNLDKNNYMLLFFSEDLQTNIKVSFEDAKNQIFCTADENKIIETITAYYSYYKILKFDIFNKINKVKDVIILLDAIKNEDENKIINKDLKKYSDVFPKDALFDNMINDLIVLVENYYKRNHVCSLEGQPNDADFIKRLRHMLEEKQNNENDEENSTTDEEITNRNERLSQLEEENNKKIKEDNQILFKSIAHRQSSSDD